MTVALVTDSTSNLDADLAASRGIHIAPLYVVWGEESLRDGVELPPTELYGRLRQDGGIPKTSQVTVNDFATLFENVRQAEGAREVVCAVISSALSGTYASAIQARDQVDFPVHVIDSRQVSWALGFTLLAAAEARDSGASADKIAQMITERSQHTQLLFTIESLDYLHRGGRIGNAARLLGSALSIKPILGVQGGIIDTVDKVRTRKRSIEHMVRVAADRLQGRTVRRLAVIHGDCSDEGQMLLELAVESLHPAESYLSYVTSVLGVHTGPGGLGLNYEWLD